MPGSERSIIDPDNRYPADGLREVERQALRVLALLPDARVERTRDVIQIDWRGDEGFATLITAEALELRMPTVEWTMGAYGPAPASQLWRREAWDNLEDTALQALLDAAYEARQSEFITCTFCGKRVPPEHAFDEETCQGCASDEYGIVY